MYFTSGLAAVTDAGASAPFPAGTASRLTIKIPAAPGGLTSIVYTVMNAGAATSMTCTITGAATTCSDLVNTSIFLIDGSFSIRAVPVSNPLATAVASANWSIRITP